MNRKRRINYFIPVAVVAGIGLAIYTSNKPWKVYQQEKSKANDMRSELETTQKGNAKLRQKDQIMNPTQKEEEARRMGFVRPDETPLPDKSTQAPASVTEEPKAPRKKSTDAAPPIDLKGSDTNDGVDAAPQ